MGIGAFHSWFTPPRNSFRTRNLHLAAILCSQGFRLADVDRSDPENCEYVFRDSRELQATCERFEARLPIFVEARRLIYSWKYLRKRIEGRDDKPMPR
jgi:hypothetical protein